MLFCTFFWTLLRLRSQYIVNILNLLHWLRIVILCRIFVMPLYDGLIIEQWLLHNRYRKDVYRITGKSVSTEPFLFCFALNYLNYLQEMCLAICLRISLYDRFYVCCVHVGRYEMNRSQQRLLKAVFVSSRRSTTYSLVREITDKQANLNSCWIWRVWSKNLYNCLQKEKFISVCSTFGW